MSARIVLVTGTDTGVGKTVVAAGLARRLAGRGRRVLAIKPVESGCAGAPREEEDGAVLARATGQESPREALVRLREPIAPPLAAEREGVVLDHHEWCAEIRRLATDGDIVLVEGAGGLLSPLTWEATSRDLARALAAEALVVAPDRLGCLNHVLLTLAGLRDAGIPVRGVVFCAPGTPDASTGGNPCVLGRIDPKLRVAALARLADPSRAADHLDDVADWLEE